MVLLIAILNNLIVLSEDGKSVEEILFIEIVTSIFGCEENELLLDVANVRFLQEVETSLDGIAA